MFYLLPLCYVMLWYVNNHSEFDCLSIVSLQMLVCLEDDYESPDEQSDKKKRDKDRRFQWNHGSEFSANDMYLYVMSLTECR